MVNLRILRSERFNSHSLYSNSNSDNVKTLVINEFFWPSITPAKSFTSNTIFHSGVKFGLTSSEYLVNGVPFKNINSNTLI
jgi:hypothetical protein